MPPAALSLATPTTGDPVQAESSAIAAPNSAAPSGAVGEGVRRVFIAPQAHGMEPSAHLAGSSHGAAGRDRRAVSAQRAAEGGGVIANTAGTSGSPCMYAVRVSVPTARRLRTMTLPESG